VLTWVIVPKGLGSERRAGTRSFPILRLSILTLGIFAIAAAGPVEGTVLRASLMLGGIAIIGFAFYLDRLSSNRLFPSDAVSLRSTVGLALWIMFLTGVVQMTLLLFMPLLLQVVHGVSPLIINVLNIAISFAWTLGTVWVSGWSGAKERAALWAGPLLMAGGLTVIAATAQLPMLTVITIASLVYGFGIGIHHVHTVSRGMTAAAPGEERVTASAMPAIRSLGTAVGAAAGGVIATLMGLDVTSAAAVGNAVAAVYALCVVVIAVVAGLMFWLLHIGRNASTRPAVVSAD
jgi:predicted MFS family arabinose efflux permease